MQQAERTTSPTAAAPTVAGPIHAGPGATAGARFGQPRITPTRRHLDNRNPDLSFLIDTAGRPCFRVRIATEASLLDESEARRRTARNYFDSGSQPASPLDRQSTYLVPRGALLALMPARAIHYAALAAEDAAGRGAVAAARPATGTGAAAVSVAPDFRGKGLGMMPGVRVEDLRPVVRPASAAALLDDAAAWTPAFDAAAAETEDGEDQFGHAAAEDAPWADEEDAAGGQRALAGDGYDDGFGDAAGTGAAAYGHDPEEEPGEDHDGPAAGPYAAFEEEPGEDREAYGAAHAFEEEGEDEDGPARAYGAFEDEPGEEAAEPPRAYAADEEDDPHAYGAFEEEPGEDVDEPPRAHAVEDEDDDAGPAWSHALEDEDEPDRSWAEAAEEDEDQPDATWSHATEDEAEEEEEPRAAWAAAEDEEEPGEDRALESGAALERYGDEADEDRHAAAPVAEGAAAGADGYDDGFGALPAEEERRPPPRDGGAYGLHTHAAAATMPPEPLPDEEAEAAHPHGAASHAEVDDAVEIADAAGYAETYAAAATAAPEPRPFGVEARKAILALIMPFESGPEGFARVGADGEFEGRYGEAHPAYRRFHLGLTFGAFPWVQENGSLLRLLLAMQARDPAAFERIFGGEDSRRMLAVLRTDGPHAAQSPDGWSPRLAKVGGHRLWEGPWVERFRAAGRDRPFQGVQNRLASETWIEPMLPFARGFGLDTARALLLVVDRAVQMGVAGAKRWFAEAVNPVATPAQRQQALAALGHAGLATFQRAAGLPPTDQPDPDTEAALVGALRASGGRSPVPLPTTAQMVDAMLRRAAGSPWEARMRRLAAAPLADDAVYRI